MVNCHLLHKDDGGYCLCYWVSLLVNCGIIIVIGVNVVVLRMLDMVDSLVIVSGVIVAKL